VMLFLVINLTVSDTISKSSSILLVISAPSGVGKTTLLRMMLASYSKLQQSISVTTRSIRSNEQDGIDYHFVAESEYNQMKWNGDFIESTEVHGNFYGTSGKYLDKMLSSDLDVALVIDWRGAAKIKSAMKKYNVLSIFILPPSMQELRKRLILRGQDDNSAIELRLSNAIEEIEHYIDYDYVIVNDNLNTAFEEISAIYNAYSIMIRTRNMVPVLVKKLLQDDDV